METKRDDNLIEHIKRLDLKSLEATFRIMQQYGLRVHGLDGAAYLDDILGSLFEAVFIADKKLAPRLLTGLGPIASFYSRIELAAALGLISKTEHHDLNLIRKIRNDLAHGHGQHTFESDSIKQRCDKLKLPDDSTVAPLAYMLPLGPMKSKSFERYNFSVGVLMFLLMHRRDHAQRPTQNETVSANTVNDIAELITAIRQRQKEQRDKA